MFYPQNDIEYQYANTQMYSGLKQIWTTLEIKHCSFDEFLVLFKEYCNLYDEQPHELLIVFTHSLDLWANDCPHFSLKTYYDWTNEFLNYFECTMPYFEILTAAHNCILNFVMHFKRHNTYKFRAFVADQTNVCKKYIEFYPIDRICSDLYTKYVGNNTDYSDIIDTTALDDLIFI